MHVSARKCSDRLEYRSDNRLRFGASFMPPGRSMFSAKMTAPARLDPADPPADLRFDTRLPSGLCPQDQSRPASTIDILDQTLMLDLERKLVSIQFSWKSTCSMAEIRRAPSSQEAIDTSGQVGVAILNPSQILLFAPHRSHGQTADTPIPSSASWMSAGSDPDSNRQSPVSRHPPNPGTRHGPLRHRAQTGHEAL